MKAFGQPDNISLDLSSEPALSQNNIFSLIAFGYTADLDNQISFEERQNLSNAAIGSFIFDRFKVTDILKKQLGVDVVQGTTLVQSNQSLLQGRSGDSTSDLARTRTATTIALKKRINESLRLSVQSTIGGNVGNRQRMDLNYGLKPGIELEGVFELRTNTEGTGDAENSIGGDIKFRKTFK